jgi:primosomal protein N' (replication factor Y) (superfamily II helicase)
MPPARPGLVLKVAVPAPLRQLFDYLPPRGGELPAPGCRCEVPFGNRTLVGVVWGHEQSDIPNSKLKAVRRVIDDQPLLDDDLLALCDHAAAYYHHPIGDVVATTLPVLLRQGNEAVLPGRLEWQLTPQGRFAEPAALGRAPRQQQALELLQQHPHGLPADMLAGLDIQRSALVTLEKKGWVALREVAAPSPTARSLMAEVPPTPGTEQQAAIRAIQGSNGFTPFLLDGITGSGKTEVYLQAMEPLLKDGKQILVLVPEIGLTPQTVRRFEKRFNVTVISLHSGMTDRERLHGWLRARRGEAAIILGTRSAIFTPLARPGMIIVDEAHDGSLKQQDGLRYSARDLAVWRARLLDVPVILGSATPALETLQLARAGRYRHLKLHNRAGNATPPTLLLEDCRTLPGREPLSPASLRAIGETLQQKQQALIFINRRGYSPLIHCHDCGWEAECRHCSVHMTWHKRDNRLICHHCGAQQRIPRHCPVCNSTNLGDAGTGTEKLEELLEAQFPGQTVIRVDRDSTRRKGSLDAALKKVHGGAPAILVGTQMLAKGHHFPNLTLAIILDADGGFLSSDFRGPEHAGQLILQVAGRTGREKIAGRVLIQSRHPDHPLLQLLLSGDYHKLADALLRERREVGLPPFGHLALIRTESAKAEEGMALLGEVAALEGLPEGVQLLGPIPAPIERRQARFRTQLLLLAPDRPPLHRAIDALLARLDAHPIARRSRWHLDVDPVDLL